MAELNFNVSDIYKMIAVHEQDKVDLEKLGCAILVFTGIFGVGKVGLI